MAGDCKARGHFVRALARNPSRLDAIRGSIDEIFEGEVTRPDTLDNLCQGIDAVFSSVGITRQRDGLTFRDVDFQGNLNLLRSALGAGVGKFVYVSVLDGPGLRHLQIVDAHEAFVDELALSGVDYSVVRPTGYFSDMTAFLDMAVKGRVYLIGPGGNRMNPVHGADLAVTCVDALEGDRAEIAVGGPEVLSYREIAGLAFDILGRPERITRVPAWMAGSVVAMTKVFSRHQGELLAFFTSAMTRDTVAPCTGTRRLRAYFESRIRQD